MSDFRHCKVSPFPQHVQNLSSPILCSTLFQEGFNFDDAVLLGNSLQSCLGQFLCLHPLAMSHIFLLICLISFCMYPDGFVYWNCTLSCGEYLWLLDSTRVCSAPLGFGCKIPLYVQLGSESRFHFVLSLSMIQMARIAQQLNAGVLDHSL